MLSDDPSKSGLNANGNYSELAREGVQSQTRKVINRDTGSVYTMKEERIITVDHQELSRRLSPRDGKNGYGEEERVFCEGSSNVLDSDSNLPSTSVVSVGNSGNTGINVTDTTSLIRNSGGRFRKPASPVIIGNEDLDGANGFPPPESQIDFRHKVFLPFMVMSWLQIAFNLFIIVVTIALIAWVVLTIRHDINLKAVEYSTEILAQIDICARDYRNNQCFPKDSRLPALERQCVLWEACMNQDPMKVARAKISAVTIAQIVDSFVQNISLKTMFFFAFIVVMFFFVSNTALSFTRKHLVPFIGKQ